MGITGRNLGFQGLSVKLNITRRNLILITIEASGVEY